MNVCTLNTRKYILSAPEAEQVEVEPQHPGESHPADGAADSECNVAVRDPDSSFSDSQSDYSDLDHERYE